MATWQHLRSSTANKRPTTSLADGRIAINTNTASPGLFFKDSAGTGIVKVGPVHVGTTAPNSVPAAGGSSGNYLGEQWLDTSVSPAQMKVWNGSTWVGVVADELPVSKLQDGAARQLIQTDAAGTGVEWTSNVDVPGTLDVTSTATFDSIAQHPLGSAAAPTLTFTGDNNTGIYSPGADQVAISTGGTERARIDSSGRLLVGTSSAPPAVETIVPQFVSSSAGASTGAQDVAIYNYQNAGGSGRQRVGPKLLLGNSRSGTNGSLGGIVVSGDQVGNIRFAGDDGSAFLTAAEILAEVDGTPGTNDMPGRLVFSTTADGASSPTERMRISNAGTTTLTSAASTAPLIVNISSSEVVRIDSSGRLLVGTSTSTNNASTNDKQAIVLTGGLTGGSSTVSYAGGNSSETCATINLKRSRSTIDGFMSAHGAITGGWKLGELIFSGTDGTDFSPGASISARTDGSAWTTGDTPGVLVFSTTADGASSPTERMRIKNNGTINFSNVAVYADNAAATTGGLAVGDVYRTSTGQLMIRY